MFFYLSRGRGNETSTNIVWYLYSFRALFVLYEAELDNKSPVFLNWSSFIWRFQNLAHSSFEHSFKDVKVYNLSLKVKKLEFLSILLMRRQWRQQQKTFSK